MPQKRQRITAPDLMGVIPAPRIETSAETAAKASAETTAKPAVRRAAPQPPFTPPFAWEIKDPVCKDCFTIIDANDDGIKWQWATRPGMKYLCVDNGQGTLDPTRDDYLVTKAVYLEHGYA